MAVVCLNAQVKKKMTCNEFLRNNRGINNGENLPAEFLQAIYGSIVRNEIRTTSEAETGAFEVSAAVAPQPTFLNGSKATGDHRDATGPMSVSKLSLWRCSAAAWANVNITAHLCAQVSPLLWTELQRIAHTPRGTMVNAAVNGECHCL